MLLFPDLFREWVFRNPQVYLITGKIISFFRVQLVEKI
jgi:hypothetical protein